MTRTDRSDLDRFQLTNADFPRVRTALVIAVAALGKHTDAETLAALNQIEATLWPGEPTDGSR
jgi:hypothetical protein